MRAQCTRVRHKLDTQKGVLSDILTRVATTQARQDELEAEERTATRDASDHH